MARLTIVAILWAVTLLRVRTARRYPAARPMWWAFTALVLALTVETPQIGPHLDAAAHVTNLSTLIRHLSGMLAAASLLELVIASTQPTKVFGHALAWRHVITGVAMAALGCLFAFEPRLESSDFINSAPGHPVATTYEAVWLCYVGLVMLCAAAMFTVGWQRSDSKGRLMRARCAMLAAATTLAVVYAAVRLVVLAASLSGAATTSQCETGFRISNLVQDAAIVVLLTASCVPALIKTVTLYQDRRDLAALRPLWQLVTPFRPDTVLYPEAKPGSDGDGDLRGIGLLRFRLIRRTMEIRDALSILYEYCDLDPRPYAEAHATINNLAGINFEAHVEAVTIRYALMCARRVRAAKQLAPEGVEIEINNGIGETQHAFVGPQRGADDDLRAEVRWLLAVTHALDNHLRMQMALIPILADRNELMGTP